MSIYESRFLPKNRVNKSLTFFFVFYLLGLLAIIFLALPLSNIFGLIGKRGVWASLVNQAVLSATFVSLITATSSTLLSALFGIPLGYLLARVRFPGRGLISTLILLPLTLPPTVAGVLLLMVYGPQTFIGGLAQSLGWRLTESIWGVMLAQIFVSSPFMIIAARSSFANIEPRLEQSSLLLGKTPWATFKKVTLPLARRGLLAGVILTWARALGEFGATMVLAYNPHSLPVQIWVSFISQGLSATLPIILILLFLGSLILTAIHHLGKGPNFYD